MSSPVSGIPDKDLFAMEKDQKSKPTTKTPKLDKTVQALSLEVLKEKATKLNFACTNNKIAFVGEFLASENKTGSLRYLLGGLRMALRPAPEASRILINDEHSGIENVYSWPPIWVAAFNGRKEIVGLLLEYSHLYDPHAQEGLTGFPPIETARRRGHKDVVKILEAHKNTSTASKSK